MLPTPPRSITRPFALTLALAAGAALISCTGNGNDQAKRDTGAPPDMDAAAAGLEQVYAKREQGQGDAGSNPAATNKPAPRKSNSTASRPAFSDPTAAATDANNPDDVSAALPDSAPKPDNSGFRQSPPSRNTPTRIGAADYTPGRKGQLLDQLADVISAEPLTVSSTFGRAAQLTVLSSLDPSVNDPRLAVLRDKLSASQREVLSAVREVFTSLPAQRNGDAESIAALFRSAADRLDSTRSAYAATLDVPTVALCRRVESYGRYTPLASGALVAGKASAAYLYVEVENFAHRPVGSDESTHADQFQVEIGQEIEVRTADDTLVLHVPEQVAKDVATRRRRDFYIFQRLDFPATLSVGSYSIKAIVRDRISGTTREVILPLQVVSDQNLANIVPPPVKMTAVPTP